MAKKVKQEAALPRVGEFDQSLYSTFCTAANALSQIYAQGMNQQKAAFHAGERHALDKVYQWILKQNAEGSRENVVDIVAYLQNEIGYGQGDLSTSPTSFQHLQSTTHSINVNNQAGGFSGQTTMPARSSKYHQADDFCMDMHNDGPNS